MNSRQKTVVSFISLLFLLLTCVTTTFAWTINNSNVYLSKIEVEISTGDGILVSIKPNTGFKSTISEEEIKESIVIKYLGYKYVDDLLVDKNNNRVDLTSSDVASYFNQIKLETTTSLDGVNFKDFNGQSTEPSGGKFVSFDLYFEALENEYENEETDIFFNYSRFNYDETNKLIKQTRLLTDEYDKITTTSDTTKANYLKADLTTVDLNGDSKVIASATEGFEIYAANAARFSTTCIEFSEEVTKIYEPNIGLGSYASDLDSSKYKNSNMYLEASYLDKSKSASFTYLTNINNGLEVERAKVAVSDIPFTYKDFYTYEADHILSIKKGQTKSVNFCVWLEGRDADCFDAIIGSKVRIDLAFTTKSQTMYEKLKTINYHSNDEIFSLSYYDYDKFNVYLPLNGKNAEFYGWYTDESYTTLFDFSSVIDSLNTNFDVYAKWI